MIGKFLQYKNNKKVKNALKLSGSLIEKSKQLKNLQDFEIRNAVEKASSIQEKIPYILEAISRSMSLDLYKTQVAAILLSAQENIILEIPTGEGKTIIAAATAVLAAVDKNQVFVVTANDYLAKRDREWNLPFFNFFNLKSSNFKSGDSMDFRRPLYDNSNIVYTTSPELAFDYLRDNTVKSKADKLFQNRVFDFVIIDEADSILIDEASVPLILSAPSTNTEEKIIRSVFKVVQELSQKDFVIDIEANSVFLTPEGVDSIERKLSLDNLYDEKNIYLLKVVDMSLRALHLMKINEDYLVEGGQIYPIDPSTGRTAHGRKMNDGLHQLLEIKESLPVTVENSVHAKITFQSFFNKFNRIVGMTGTAATEREEFAAIYNLEVIVVPTNKPSQRKDLSDSIFLTKKGALFIMAEQIKKLNKEGQPILIGTTTVQDSIVVSKELKSRNIPHKLLNAKNPKEESSIISKAGVTGSVTVATNMAGRGADIKLDKEAISRGGLFVIGFGHHISRRVDNQLRGRSGRQGEPGATQFFVSLEDDLIQDFGGKAVHNFVKAAEIEEYELIKSRSVRNFIEKSQKSLEDMTYAQRSQLVKYDKPLSTQRDIVYKMRDKVLDMNSMHDLISLLGKIAIDNAEKLDYHDYESLKKQAEEIFGIFIKKDTSPQSVDELVSWVISNIIENFTKIPEKEGVPILRSIYLSTLDDLWVEHLVSLENYRLGVDFVSLSHRDPLIEYEKMCFTTFENFLKSSQLTILKKVMRTTIKINQPSKIREI